MAVLLCKVSLHLLYMIKVVERFFIVVAQRKTGPHLHIGTNIYGCAAGKQHLAAVQLKQPPQRFIREDAERHPAIEPDTYSLQSSRGRRGRIFRLIGDWAWGFR